MPLLRPQTATNHHDLGFLIMMVLLAHMNNYEVQFEEMGVLVEMHMILPEVLAEMCTHLLAVQG